MWTAILAVAAAVCGIGWLCNHISTLVLSYWIATKGYTPPTDDETKACINEVVKHLFRIK